MTHEDNVKKVLEIKSNSWKKIIDEKKTGKQNI